MSRLLTGWKLTERSASVARMAGSERSSALPPAARVRPSILMVDDQPARLLTYEAILSNLGLDCVRALSGEEALQKLLGEDFAVILLDVNMPGMDGFELARLIREHPRLEKTPIIFVTAVHVTEFDRLRGYEAGAIDYISVPVIPEVLRSKVAILVELHQRRRELQEVNQALATAREQLVEEHERALRDTREQLAAVFEHPSEAIAVLEAVRDETGAIQDWVFSNANTNAQKLVGLSREELIGRRLREILPDDRVDRRSELCTRVLQTGEKCRYEARYGDTDFLVTLFPMGRDRVISAGVDITDHKRVEAALRASERRYQALIEDAPVAVSHNALSGRFQYANKAFCQLVGYTAEELCERTWQDITHPDDVGADEARSARVIAGDRASYTMEKRYLRKDGAPVWVNLFGNFVLDDAGAPLQGVAVAIDITDRKRAESAIRESEERIREIANNIDQFAWTCNELGQATWYNARWYEYTGTTFEEMKGDGWKAVIHPEHLPRMMSHLQECVALGVPWEDTFPIRGKDGRFRWFLSRAVPIPDEDGQVRRWFGTNTDVTELRQLQDAFREADRRKDHFLAMLAHELRNPVAPITSAAEALSRMMADNETARGLAGIVRRQAQNLSRLLDDLLDVARITQGHIQLKPEIVAIETCIGLALETSRPLIQEKRHQLTIGQSPEPLYVNADRVRLAQCLSNVLNNAAKYTDAGGEIRIRPFVDGTDAVVEVTDNGQGIAAEFLPHMFELFAQSERALDRSQGGLGIGLSVCRQLMQLQGGSVSGSSAGPGKGATFSLRIPLAKRKPMRSATIEAKSSALRVLVVDDNRDAADSLGLLLQLEGHEVETAYSAEEGLTRLQGFLPDIALLDIGLPGMNGYELARRMRASAMGLLTLIAVSGYGQAEDKARSKAAGFDAHLTKPVEIHTLKKVIAGAMSPE